MWNAEPFMGNSSLHERKGHRGIHSSRIWLKKSILNIGQMPFSKRSVVSSTIVLFVFVIFNINSTTQTLDTIRRMLCLENANGAQSPYIYGSQVSRGTQAQTAAVPRVTVDDLENQMKPPPIAGRRPIPSHIEMCQNFLQRRDAHISGQEMAHTIIHVVEDVAVCTDWSTPHSSLLQIFSGEVINQVAQKYGVTYSHECHKTPRPITGDGLDWTTIQQEFPPSGLVLDDGTISEDEVAGLCKGCLSVFNAVKSEASVDKYHPNPDWFHPHATHHCIMYPGTERPIVNEYQEMDMAALQEQRMRAQQAPLGKLYRTVQDRLQLSAAKHKLENKPSSVEDQEEKDGVVIFLDEDSMAMSGLQIDKNIPRNAKTISVLLSPMCVHSEWEEGGTCVDYSNFLMEHLAATHPAAEVNLDVPVSTAAAVSRMIRARTLICPPGTTECLIPAMSKEEDTFAVVGESMKRARTEQFFDLLSTSRFSLQIANVDESDMAQETVVGQGRASEMNDEDLLAGLTSFTAEGGNGKSSSLNGFVDGCVETRGNIGDWEQDFLYEDLASDKNALLRGSSLENESNFEEGQRSRGSNGILGRNRSWNDSNPECGLDMLEKDGLCEVMDAMKLGVLQFVGDKYTEEMVRSFWSLIGVEDGDVGEDGTSAIDPKKYRKTIHCPNEGITFDIAFTPNEQLQDLPVQSTPVIAVPPLRKYVPVVSPVHAPVEPVTPFEPVVPRQVNPGQGITHVNPNPNPGIGYNGGYNVGYNGGYNVGYNGGYNVGYNGVGRTVGTAGNCWTNPYGAGCACDPNTQMRAVAPPPQPMPQFNQACQCVPFQQQYQYNYAAAVQPVQSQQYQSGSGRQMIVGGVTPNQPFNNFVQNVDNFGRTVTNSIDSNDIVVLRTGATVPAAYGGRRRTENSDTMTHDEIIEANNYLHRSVDEFRRRTHQSNLLSYDPVKSRMPLVHILDVAHMTHSHPLAESDPKGHRNLENTPNLYDHWNHLLYSTMRDLAKAELKRKSLQLQPKQQSAPPGSPYHNAVPLFP